MAKTYKIDEASEFLTRLAMRKAAIFKAEAELNEEFASGKEELGSTFCQAGQWYQIRLRGGSHYMVTLPSSPADYIRPINVPKADLAEVVDVSSAEPLVEVPFEIGDDEVGFTNEDLALAEADFDSQVHVVE
jgi:hypothetical protein